MPNVRSSVRRPVRAAEVRRLLAILSLLLVPSVATVAGEPAWPDGHERVVEMRRAMRGAVSGGTIRDVRWSEDGTSVAYRIGDLWHRCDLETGAVTADVEPPADEARAEPPSSPRRPRPARGRQRTEEPSPDGLWTAACVDWNVVLRHRDFAGDIAVTTGGTAKQRFGSASWVYGEELDQIDAMFWSPDSRYLAFYELDERPVRDFYLLDGWTTTSTSIRREGYPKAGTPNPIAAVHVYDLRTGETVRVDTGDDEEAYLFAIRFSPAGNDLLINRMNRHQNRLDLLAADPATGETRVVLTEAQETWQATRPECRFLADGRRFLWISERTGFAHLELRSLDDGPLALLSSGEYPVESIERVDEDLGVVWYSAFSGETPLDAQLHRVALEGSDHRVLSTGPGNHRRFEISPDGQWVIASAEAIDAPPSTHLYDARGVRVATLAAPDTSGFDALGLTMPERFSFTADDGETELFGVLYKPADFDPSKVYPLVVYVYGGPHSRLVPNRWRAGRPETEYGVLIASIDNRGTEHRGKDFEGATYLRLGDVDLKDQADGARFLAERPYVDGSRVGIYGSSYGGYLAALALLRHPDVFHVGVASVAVTDSFSRRYSPSLRLASPPPASSSPSQRSGRSRRRSSSPTWRSPQPWWPYR